MDDARRPPLDAACLDCGYALRDLPTARCPECGRPFDPARPESMRLPVPPVPPFPWSPPMRVVAAWAGTALAVAYVLGVCFVNGSRANRLPAVLVAGFYVASRVRRVLEPPPTTAARLGRRLKWAALFALTLVLTGTAHTCVHGTMVGSCGVGLARSEIGGPCQSGAYGNRFRHLSGDWYVWWQ